MRRMEPFLHIEKCSRLAWRFEFILISILLLLFPCWDQWPKFIGDSVVIAKEKKTDAKEKVRWKKIHTTSERVKLQTLLVGWFQTRKEAQQNLLLTSTISWRRMMLGWSVRRKMAISDRKLSCSFLFSRSVMISLMARWKSGCCLW